jgi:hypothetical protein
LTQYDTRRELQKDSHRRNRTTRETRVHEHSLDD